MKQRQFDQRNEIMISAEDLDQANLAGFDRLELHLLNQAVVIFPGEMTASELIEVSDSLLKLTAGLVDGLLKSCSNCDNCGQQEPCTLMSAKSDDEDIGTALSEESTDESEFLQISPELQKMLRDRIFTNFSRTAKDAPGTSDMPSQSGRENADWSLGVSQW